MCKGEECKGNLKMSNLGPYRELSSNALGSFSVTKRNHLEGVLMGAVKKYMAIAQFEQ